MNIPEEKTILTLLELIPLIAHRESFGASKWEILEDLQEEYCFGKSTFFWAWQAATYIPRESSFGSCSSNGEKSFRASCILTFDKGDPDPVTIEYNHG